MPERSVARPLPASPPESTIRGEAEWTTGQGIGFLVALPGWIAVALSIVVFVISATGAATTEISGVSLFGVGVVLVVGGTVSAIPGTIVFDKCKRQ